MGLMGFRLSHSRVVSDRTLGFLHAKLLLAASAGSRLQFLPLEDSVSWKAGREIARDDLESSL